VKPATLEHEQSTTPVRRIAPIALFATAVPIVGNLAMLTAGPFIAVYMRGTGTVGAMWFALGYAFLGAIAVAPTYSTSMIAGWAFGVRDGFFAVLFGTVVGATLCYAVARRWGLRRVMDAFHDHERIETVRRALVEENFWKTLWIVFLLRISPILPFGTTNILLATSGVHFGTFVTGTILGIIPRIGAIFIAAAGAHQLDFKRQQSWWILAAGIAATILCVVIMTIIGKRALDRATHRPGASQ
jgi:uncharacterized membrane protein YdjX (TVP38/TMEM64 family)